MADYSIPNAWAFTAGLSVTLLLSACSSQPPAHLGVGANGMLAPCPPSPNCVSSQADEDDAEHLIAPLNAGPDAWESLPLVLSSDAQLRVVAQSETYIHAEATSFLFRFVDDLEFLYQPDQGLVQVRSGSRTGYSDFGVNRTRLEAIRQQLAE